MKSIFSVRNYHASPYFNGCTLACVISQDPSISDIFKRTLISPKKPPALKNRTKQKTKLFASILLLHLLLYLTETSV